MSNNDEEPDELEVGMAIEARYEGKSKWYKGTVTKIRRSRPLDVRLEVRGRRSRGTCEAQPNSRAFH